MKKLIFFWLLAAMLALPLCGFSQTWSKKEQAFLDDFTKKWEQFCNKPSTWELWKTNVHPDDELAWWWTDEGMPKDLNAVKAMFQNFEKQGTVANNFHLRPIKINIVGDVAMIWFYGYISLTDKAGNTSDWEDKRLEVFRRDGAGWKFLGGIADVVDEDWTTLFSHSKSFQT